MRGIGTLLDFIIPPPQRRRLLRVALFVLYTAALLLCSFGLRWGCDLARQGWQEMHNQPEVVQR
ncbi:MAG: hypothetical protein JRI59_06785 [Deltaproteobacteria bacterium]|nr:hypothetical protein [Deltaproteobacteria bacterium]